MKRILLSLAVSGAVLGTAIYATNAFFSDVETSTGNTFTAGKLDLKVDSTQHYNGNVCSNTSTEQNPVYQWVGQDLYPVPNTPCTGSWSLDSLAGKKFFDFADVKPGDDGENTISLHVYNNPAWACMRIENIVDNGQLDTNTQFKVWADICTPQLNAEFSSATVGDNIYQPLCDKEIANGTLPVLADTWTLSDSVTNVFGTTPAPLDPNQTYYVGVSWDLPTTTGNEVQGASYLADVAFYTEQHRNNPDFKCADWPTPQAP